MRFRLTFLVLLAVPSLLATEIPVTEKPQILGSSADVVGIATTGSTYLLLDEAVINFGRYGDYNFFGTILNADGTRRTVSSILLSDTIGQSAGLAAGNRQYLLVISARSGAFGLRVSEAGEVLDRTPFAIGPAGNGGPFSGAGVAWDGETYVVAGTNSAGVPFYAFVGQDGTVQAAGTLDSPLLGIAARDGVALVTTRHSDGTYVGALTRSGLSDEIQLTTGPDVGLIAGGTGFLAFTWENGTARVQRLDNSGRPIAPPTQIVVPASFKIAWDGNSYVLAWPDDSGAHALRLFESGQISAPFDIELGSNISLRAIAASGGKTEVVLRETLPVILKQIDSSNHVSPSTLAYPDVEPQLGSRLAFNGADYVVAWTENDEVRFARITATGERLDGDGITIGQRNVHLFDIAVGDGTTLVVWTELASTGLSLLHATLIDASGVVVTSKLLQPDACDIREARALWDGEQFVVFWPCNGTLAARIRTDGTIVDALPRQVFPIGLDFEVAKSKDRYQLAYAECCGGLDVVVVSSDLQLATKSTLISLPNEKVKSFTITSNGDDFLIAWNNDSEEIVTQRASWNADPVGPRVVYSTDKSTKGKPIAAFDGSEFVVTWPESVDGQTDFLARRADRNIPDAVGPAFEVASAASPLFGDWSFSLAPVPTVAYTRTDESFGVDWLRLFLQPESSLHGRAVVH